MKMNVYWKCGMALAWAGVAAAYYLNVPEFRRAVDSRLPWVREESRTWPAAPPQEPQREVAAKPPTPAPPPTRAPIPKPRVVAEAPRLPEATPTPRPLESGNKFEELARDRASWPRTVRLKQTVTFPAVVGGRVVGKLHLAAGSMANLVTMSSGKIGLEYRGGGAWVSPEQTDLFEQVQPRGVAANTVR